MSDSSRPRRRIEWPARASSRGGRPSHTKWIPIVPDAALDNLISLDPEGFVLLIRAAMQALPASICGSRAALLDRAVAPLAAAAEALETLALEFPISPESDQGALEVHAAGHVRVAMAFLAEEIRGLRKEEKGFASQAAPTSKLPSQIGFASELICDKLAGAAANLDWVTGRHLVELAIGLGAEPPLRWDLNKSVAGQAGKALREYERRRKKWTKRLRKVR